VARSCLRSHSTRNQGIVAVLVVRKGKAVLCVASPLSIWCCRLGVKVWPESAMIVSTDVRGNMRAHVS